MPQATPEFIAPLLNFGAMGCMLVWFMLRNEVRQKAQEEALDRLTRAITLQLLAQDLPKQMRHQGEELCKEVEVAEAQRRPRR